MKKPVVIGLAVVVLAAVVAGGYWWYQSRQDNARFRLHQGNLIRLVIQFAQHLARFDRITFVHCQRLNAPPNTETKIHRTNIHVAIQRRVGKECRSRWSPYH